MLNRNIEVYMGCETDFDEADTVLFGAPFDSTTSYRPGTRFGAGAIRHESYGIECYSPYQDKDLQDVSPSWTAEIWSSVLEMSERPWIRLKNGRKRFYPQASALLCWGENTW